MTSVGILDYGVGNLLSVERALEAVGGRPHRCSSPESLAEADRLVLPGVGAFGRCIERLRCADLIEPLLDWVELGRPLLGICVGMQMLLDRSEEFGDHQGLGLIEGEVRRIPMFSTTGDRLKHPHIGWSELRLVESEDRPRYYFLHSFAAYPQRQEHATAWVDIGGAEVCAAVERDNLIGVQFHPEKSGPAGLELLRNFVGGPTSHRRD